MQSLRLTAVLPTVLLALSATAASALPSKPATNADAVYQQERAACLDGSSAQDRATCLKEAGAARAEARRRSLDNGEAAAQLRANALQRCQRVADEDRSACERLALGEGQRSGSVAGGGVLKQLSERSLPAAPAPSKAP